MIATRARHPSRSSPGALRRLAVAVALFGLVMMIAAKSLTGLALANPITRLEPARAVLGAIFDSKMMAWSMAVTPLVNLAGAAVLAALAWSSAGFLSAGPIQRRSSYAAIVIMLLAELPLLAGLASALLVILITILLFLLAVAFIVVVLIMAI